MAVIVPMGDIIKEFSLDGSTVIKVREPDDNIDTPDVLTIISDVIEFNENEDYPISDLIEEISEVFMDKVHGSISKDESLHHLHRSDITAVYQDITSEVDYVVNHMHQLVADRFREATGIDLKSMKPCMTRWLKDNSLMVIGI